MTILNGIHDAEYLAQFLGKRIAIKTSVPNKYDIYYLSAIFANRVVQVADKSGQTFFFEWNECENPYVIVIEDVEIEIK